MRGLYALRTCSQFTEYARTGPALMAGYFTISSRHMRRCSRQLVTAVIGRSALSVMAPRPPFERGRNRRCCRICGHRTRHNRHVFGIDPYRGQRCDRYMNL